MALQSDKNEYRGVNAHLQSAFQNLGGWEGFHGKHIGDIAEALSAIIPSGYLVSTETSLQIREIYPDTGKVILTKPDISIHETQPTQQTPTTSAIAGATLTRPLTEALYDVEEEHYLAVVILEIAHSFPLGRPITRIELLSPSNKVGAGYNQYHQKRLATLQSGICLVEIDYHHETPPTLKQLPSYRAKEAGAFPYYVHISQPLPTFEHGTSITYGFLVDDPIPNIPIPLDANHHVMLDLNTVYQKTFMSINLYRHLADYSALPANFETYTPQDQARIQTIMARVR